MYRRLIGWTSFLFCFLSTLSAPAAEVTVVYRKVEPFVFEKDGQLQGFAMDLWRAAAQEAGITSRFREVATVSDLIDALQNKKADVAIGALSVTEDREKIIDFTHPFYQSGLQVVGPLGGQMSSLVSYLKALLRPELLRNIGFLLLAMVVASHLLWWFERRGNEESFPRPYLRGVWESLWWTTCTIITGGCENKAPVGVAGRLVAIIWMLGSIMLLSFVTASIATDMTVSSLRGGIHGPDDLPGKKVATVAGSTSESWLRNHQAQVATYPSAGEAIDAVMHQDADAAVYDAPILKYQLAKLGTKNLAMAGALFEKQGYAMGLQEGSPLRKPMNQALLKLEESGEYDALVKKWFGDE